MSGRLLILLGTGDKIQVMMVASQSQNSSHRDWINFQPIASMYTLHYSTKYSSQLTPTHFWGNLFPSLLKSTETKLNQRQALPSHPTSNNPHQPFISMGKKSANPEEKVFAGGLIGGESAFAGQDEIGPGRDVRRRTGRPLEWRFVCSLFLFWGYRYTIRLKSEPGLFYRDSAGKFCAAEYFREGKKTTWISWRYLWISSIYWIFSQILPLIAFQQNLKGKLASFVSRVDRSSGKIRKGIKKGVYSAVYVLHCYTVNIFDFLYIYTHANCNVLFFPITIGM